MSWRQASRNSTLVGLCIAMLSVAVSACTTVSPATSGKVVVVAAERQWGSIISAIGGSSVAVTNVISSPAIDPHAYEPSPRDANAVAVANYVVLNGLGYDSWMTRLIAASGHGSIVANVGERLHLDLGVNPHRWYSPTDVVAMTRVIEHDLSQIRPNLAPVFHQRAITFRTVTLADYNAERSWIRSAAAGISIGASESMFSLLMDDLHLHVATPESFLFSVSEGGEPTAHDLSLINHDLKSHAISLYLENVQNVTPAVAFQVALARSLTPPIPVVQMTETPPRNQSFAEWQTTQLHALRTALTKDLP